VAGRRSLVGAIEGYASIAAATGAPTLTLVGTEPLRRLADAARIVDDIFRATGLALHVLSHEEEAFLTLIGVTEGRAVNHDLLVVDIGGGSSELVFVGPDRPAVATGLRVGARRLSSRFVAADPPTLAELAALRAAAREAVGAAPSYQPTEMVLVGGPASNLVKVVPAGTMTRRLSSGDLEAVFRLVAEQSADAVAQRYGLRLARARMLAAGAAIVEAMMDRYGVTEVRVSEGGIREGTVLAVAREGTGWRDRLERLAHGWVG